MARTLWNLNTLLLLLASVFWTSESACPVPTTPLQSLVLVNGLVQVRTSYESGEVLRFSCPPGHELNVTNTNGTCSSSRRWIPNWPKCLYVKCPELSVANGRVSTGRRRAGSNVTIACDSGYVLGQSGSNTVMCQNNGSWNQTTPTCVPGCGSPLVNAGLQLRDSYLLQESFRVGSSVSYRCGLGYMRVGGSSVSQCTPTGWTIPTLRCDRKSCGSAGEIDNGRYIYDDGVDFGSRVYAVCNEGHHLIGENTRLCTNDGWDGREAVCEPIQCPPPPPVLGAESWGPLEEPHLYSHVITYRCRSGRLLGPREIHCTKTGTWSAPPPRCTDVTCRQPEVRFSSRTWNYKLNYRPGEQVGVACDQGRRLFGPAQLTCGADGQWKPSVPTCV